MRKRGLLRAVVSMLALSLPLAVAGAGPSGAVSGGPVVLMGIDAEDGGPGGHGPIGVYASVVNDILANASGGSGILVIGGGKPTCTFSVTPFWNAIAAATGQTVTYVNGAAIATQSFSGFEMLAVVSDESNTGCGLTSTENADLATRQLDIANFVNAGGGLLGFSSDFGPASYAYLAGIGGFTVNTGLGYSDITPTAAGTAIGITDALDVCCWHDEYLTFPSFLSVLATNAFSGNAAAIGGQNVVITVGIELAPPSAVNPSDTPHTVTATVEDSNNAPQQGVLVGFSVTAGPNTGQASDPAECVPAGCTTDANGNVAWTYTSNGQTGIDTIRACFTDAQGNNRCTQATKEWVNSPPVCTAVAPNPTGLWPPNHKLVEITLAGATDPDGDPVTITITGVTQDEALNGLGDGDTSPDAQVGSASNKVLLRAERSGTGDGRVYRIAYTASDPAGATCSGVVTVGVPHDQGPKGGPVDSGLIVNSFGP